MTVFSWPSKCFLSLLGSCPDSSSWGSMSVWAWLCFVFKLIEFDDGSIFILVSYAIFQGTFVVIYIHITLLSLLLAMVLLV